MNLHRLFAAMALSIGPGLLRQQREKAQEKIRARERAELEIGAKAEEQASRLAVHVAQREANAAAEAKRVAGLVAKYRDDLTGMTLYRSTRGYVGEDGKAISAEMAEAYERLKEMEASDA